MKTILVAAVLMITYNFSTDPIKSEFGPSQIAGPNDVIPDSATAKKIAEVIWLTRFGEKVLKQKPYRVTLKDSTVWVVSGTLPPGRRGGTAYIELRKKDCTVLKLGHYK